MRNSRNLYRGLGSILLTTVFILLCATAVLLKTTGQSEGIKSEDIKKEFNDDDLKVKEEKPRGKWGFALESDMSQFKDSSVPAVVSGIQSLSGGEKFLGVTKIKRVEVINRSPRVVNSVQLRW